MYFLLINPKEQPKPKAPLLLASTVKTVFAVSTNKLLLFQAIHIVIVLIYFFSLEYVRNKEHPVPQILCSCPVLHALEGKKKKKAINPGLIFKTQKSMCYWCNLSVTMEATFTMHPWCSYNSVKILLPFTKACF